MLLYQQSVTDYLTADKKNLTLKQRQSKINTIKLKNLMELEGKKQKIILCTYWKDEITPMCKIVYKIKEYLENENTYFKVKMKSFLFKKKIY